jgi:hypothetical protein
MLHLFPQARLNEEEAAQARREAAHKRDNRNDALGSPEAQREEEVRGCWGAGVLGCWGAGVLGCWGAGVLAQWCLL